MSNLGIKEKIKWTFFGSSMKQALRTILGLIALILPNLNHAIEIQGHRGTRALRPENTLPAFAAAIEAGADVLELDVLTTLDGELIIYHDYHINKELCTYRDGRAISDPPLVRSLTLAEIKQFDCGTKTNPKFPKQLSIPGTQIPTLQELFDLIRTSSHPQAKKVRLNLEIKRNSQFPELTIAPDEFAKKIISLVKKNDFSSRVYYSSFDPNVLSEVRRLDPNARIGFIFDAQSFAFVQKLDPQAKISSLIEFAASLKAEIISPDHRLLKDPAEIQAMKKRGFRVIPWTVNDPQRWAELIKMGVSGIITDDPLALVQFLETSH